MDLSVIGIMGMFHEKCFGSLPPSDLARKLDIGRGIATSTLRFCGTTLLSIAPVFFLAIAGGSKTQAADDLPVLRQIASIDLPGPPGKRFDYLVIDYDDGWLFSAHLAAGQTYVIDLKSNRVLHTVTDTPGAERIEYVPDERKVYTSNAADNTVGVIDLKTMKKRSQMKGIVP